MERAVVVKYTMAELIHAKFLSWRHLHLLEDPFFAKADVESAVNTHKSRGIPRNRGISNFQSWLDRTSMPLGELNYAVLNSLKNGTSYYVHRHTDKPKRPLLFWQSNDPKSNSFFGVNGSWQVHSYVAPTLRNKLKILLSRIEPPKPVVVRKVPAVASAQTAPANDKPRDERHMFLLEVETENDIPMPEKAYVTLVGFNKTQDARPVQQVNDIAWDFESRIFRAKPGDDFEIFAITDDMKTVKKDLRDNKNLSQSVSDDLIKALEVTDTYTRHDDVIVHTVKYVIPEVRTLVVDQEFGAHLSGPHHEMFVLQHEDSEWVQRVEVTEGASSKQVSIRDSGWVRVEFVNIPKKGKFSLISISMDQQSSPVVHFNAKSYDELMKGAVHEDLETKESDITPLVEDDDVVSMNEYDDWLDSWAP